MKLQEASLWRSILSISFWRRKRSEKTCLVWQSKFCFCRICSGIFYQEKGLRNIRLLPLHSFWMREEKLVRRNLKSSRDFKKTVSRYLHAWHTAWNAPKRAESGTWCEVIEGYYGGRSRYGRVLWRQFRQKKRIFCF